MTREIWQQTLEEFLDAAARGTPTPGGGSVAMVSGALGLGLVLMALNVTAKAKDAPDLSAVISSVTDLLGEIKQAPQADIDAFDGLMAAYRLPKATDEEKSARRAAVEAATLEATKTPLEAASLCLRGLELAAQAAQCGKLSILSDVEAGALLLRSAGEAVLLNVDMNLPALPDGPQRSRLQASRTDLGERLAALGAKVSKILEARAA